MVVIKTDCKECACNGLCVYQKSNDLKKINDFLNSNEAKLEFGSNTYACERSSIGYNKNIILEMSCNHFKNAKQMEDL